MHAWHGSPRELPTVQQRIQTFKRQSKVIKVIKKQTKRNSLVKLFCFEFFLFHLSICILIVLLINEFIVKGVSAFKKYPEGENIVVLSLRLSCRVGTGDFETHKLVCIYDACICFMFCFCCAY